MLQDALQYRGRGKALGIRGSCGVCGTTEVKDLLGAGSVGGHIPWSWLTERLVEIRVCACVAEARVLVHSHAIATPHKP